MTLTQFMALDFPRIWRRMTPLQQAHVGELVLRMVAAETVSTDDDSSITYLDRRAAQDANSEALQELGPLVERCAPWVEWFTPEREGASTS